MLRQQSFLRIKRKYLISNTFTKQCSVHHNQPSRVISSRFGVILCYMFYVPLIRLRLDILKLNDFQSELLIFSERKKFYQNNFKRYALNCVSNCFQRKTNKNHNKLQSEMRNGVKNSR